MAGTFTRIEPLDNSIVLFSSRIPHEITLVECDPGDFGSGRFSVNGAFGYEIMDAGRHRALRR